MRIIFDSERCTGHGRCYTLAPQVFEPDEDGHGTVIMAVIPPELEHIAKIGVDNCPERAISIAE